MSDAVINIAAYQFTTLDRLAERRAQLKPRCDALGLKGTILLSPEGINLFLAGDRSSIDAILKDLHAWPEIDRLDVKESISDRPPFRRMNVRLKQEIIAFGVDGVDPRRETSPKISPRELKRWLDEGRPLTLLDTRNRYEVELGKFVGARDLQIDDFRSFPAATDRLPDEVLAGPVVMYCTGGIRCEKAGPLLQQHGLDDVYQLDGGILRYFEECGGDHWEGECFVFDHRVALDSNLQETDTALCFACQALLSVEEQASPHYVPGESCPHCWTEGRGNDK